MIRLDPRHQALLCSRYETHDGEGIRLQVLFSDLFVANRGQLEQVWTAPVRTVVVEGCSQRQTTSAQVVQFRDGGVFVSRPADSKSCAGATVEPTLSPAAHAHLYQWEGKVCDGMGAFRWRNGKVEKSKDGVLLSNDRVKLPGATLTAACVDARAHTLSKNQYAQAHPVSMDIDLDGDGTKDTVLFGGAARWQVTHMLYLQKGDCAYFVGPVPASETPRTLARRASGLFDLHTADDDCPLASPRKPAFCDTEWRFNGTQYVRVSERITSRVPNGIRP